MKLEFLPSGSPDCPLLRLFDFDCVQVTQFRDLCLQLAVGQRETFAMPHDFPVDPTAGYQLKMKCADTPNGIRQISSSAFECVLTRTDWDNIAWLVDPFCQSEREGYQWLVKTGRISLLLSHDETW